jgi:hypothetical protein
VNQPFDDMSRDGFNHAIAIGKDLMIPESNNRKSLRVQPSRALGVLRRVLCVLPTIDFNNQTRGQADKIHDVGTDGKLSTKPHIVNLLQAQTLPQSNFGLGYRLTQCIGSRVGHPLP